MNMNSVALARIAELEAQNRQKEERLKMQCEQIEEMRSRLRAAEAGIALMKQDRNVEVSE